MDSSFLSHSLLPDLKPLKRWLTLFLVCVKYNTVQDVGAKKENKHCTVMCSTCLVIPVLIYIMMLKMQIDESPILKISRISTFHLFRFYLTPIRRGYIFRTDRTVGQICYLLWWSPNKSFPWYKNDTITISFCFI